MPDFSAPVLTIDSLKKLLHSEMQRVYESACDNLGKNIRDSEISMLAIGRDTCLSMIADCTSYEDVDAAINSIYSMSLYEWADSLGGQHYDR
jgi:hypothetical protein